MSVRAEHPLAFALGCLTGAIVADLLLIGGDVFAHLCSGRQHTGQAQPAPWGAK